MSDNAYEKWLAAVIDGRSVGFQSTLLSHVQVTREPGQTATEQFQARKTSQLYFK